MKKLNIKESDFTQVNRDSNGNPRYVIHFMEFLTEEEKCVTNYNLACKRANKVGGKKYRGSDFGGGVVFQVYDLRFTCDKINKMDL